MTSDPCATPDQYSWIADQLELLSATIPEVVTPEQRVDAARRAAIRASIEFERRLLDFVEVTLL
jgi:hypothetical protein